MKRSITILSLIFAAAFTGPDVLAINDALKIRIARGSYSDETVVRFVAGGTEGFDANYDAWKLFSSNTSVPNIFTRIVSAGDLAINALPTFTASVTTDLYLKIGTSATYTISAEELGAFSSDVKIVMKDLVSGQVYDLRSSATYTVSLPIIAQTSAARFQVLFSYPAATNITNATCMVCADGMLSVSKPGETGWQYTVFDQNANSVASGTATTTTQNIASLTKGSYTVTITGSIPYSENKTFTVGVAPVILGATFIEFNALYEQGTIFLSWTTGMESNTSYFSVQRSEDGINFQSIEHIPAAGNSSAMRIYNAADPAPKGKTAYYQIKLTDLNGAVSYSTIVPVTISSSPFLSVYPIPANQMLNVHISDNKDVEVLITLRDLQGKEVLHARTVPASDNMTLEISIPSFCTPGIYTLTASGQKIEIIEKIIIN